jgi:LPS export ABC transporter protein LptC
MPAESRHSHSTLHRTLRWTRHFTPRRQESRADWAAVGRLVRIPAGLALAVLILTAGALQAESPLLEVDAMTFVASRGPSNELVLRAAHARFDTEQKRVYLEEVHAIVEPGRSAGSFEIRCDEGELDIATNNFEARGNVRGRTDGDREFTAPWVKYDHEAGLLFTNAPVLISEDAITYRGGGFQYYVRERRFRLLGGASVVQEP